MKIWYYELKNEKHGPIKQEELEKLIQQDTVKKDNYVWREELNDWILASKLPFFRKHKRNYASFWRRAFAYIIDIFFISFLTKVLIGILSSDTVPSVQRNNFYPLCTFLIGWLYYALTESSIRQATPGKVLLDMIVTDIEGKRITFSKASSRYFSQIISGLILGIGYIMAAFTEKKQALHDKISGCIVLKDNINSNIK